MRDWYLVARELFAMNGRVGLIVSAQRKMGEKGIWLELDLIVKFREGVRGCFYFF